MNIGVMGDTHGHKGSMERAVENMKDCSLTVHTGDNFVDSCIIHKKTGMQIIAVKGNCDFENVEEEIVFEISGKKIFLCHGHKYEVKKGIQQLWQRAQQEGADIVIFGHTHIPCFEKINGIYFINPGSTSRPRSGKSSAGILSIDDGRVEFRLFGV